MVTKTTAELLEEERKKLLLREGDVSAVLAGIDRYMAETKEAAFEPFVLSPEQALEYGIELDLGWQLEVSPAPGTEAGVASTLLSPEGWRITEAGEYISPEGESYSQEEIEAAVGFQEAALTVFPEMEIADVQAFATEKPQEFMAEIAKMGRTAETEALLEAMGFGAEEVESLFLFPEGAPWQIVVPEERWHIGNWAIPVQAQATVKGVGRVFYYADMPWIVQWAGTALGMKDPKDLTPEQLDFVETFQRAIEELGTPVYGPMGEVISPMSLVLYRKDIWEKYEKMEYLSGWAEFGVSVLNPIWWLPVGGVAGVAAQATKGVAVLGRTMQTIARAVQILEKVAVAPIVWPVRGVSKGVKFVIRRGDVEVAEQIARGTIPVDDAVARQMADALPQLDDAYMFFDIPTFEDFSSHAFRSTPGRRLTQAEMKIPVFKRPIEVLGRLHDPRLTVRIEDEAAKQSLYNLMIKSQGRSVASSLRMTLRAISVNPRKLFGLDKRGFAKVVTTAKGYDGASLQIMEILENPIRYNLTTQQVKYITTLHRLIDEVTELMIRHGVDVPRKAYPEFSHFVHRVVTGKVTEDVMVTVRGGTAIGRKPSFMRPRRFETAQEGVEAGITYALNPELMLTGYVEEGFGKIADVKLAQAIRMIEGVRIPSDNPALKAFEGALDVALKGGRPAKQTLARIEKDFPELGRRLRQAVETPTKEVEKLRIALEQLDAQLLDVRTKLRTATARDAAEAVSKKIEVGKQDDLVKAFEKLDYDDRLDYRNFLEEKRTGIGEMLMEQKAESAGIKEFLATDLVASYRGKWGKRTGSLTAVLTKEGKWPESLTPNQARLLLMGREIKPAVLTKEGRVRWEYVIDELSEHFHMTEQEFINHLEHIASSKQTLNDLQRLVGDASLRSKEIDEVIRALNQVDAKASNLPRMARPEPPEIVPEVAIPEEAVPEAIPKAAPGELEAGIQKGMFDKDVVFRPKGKGQITQISMDDLKKLVELREKEGLPGLPPGTGVDPDTGIAWRATFETPKPMTAAERDLELKAIRAELSQMSVPTGLHLGEVAVSHPAFRGWSLPPELANTLNYYHGARSNVFLKASATTAGVIRMLKASLDFSVGVIQCLPAMGATMATLNPRYMVKWFQMFPKMVGVFFKPEIYAAWAAKNSKGIQQRISYMGSEAISDWYQAVPQISRAAGHLPGGERLIRETFGRFEQSFGFGIDYMRQTVWDALSPNAIKRGNGFKLAEFCDHLVGVVDTPGMGIPPWLRDLESGWLWFAPRYTRACLKLVGDIFHGGYTSREALKAFGGLLGAGVVMYTAICEAVEQTPNFDPTSARFMTIRVGDHYIGIGGFWYSGMRFLTNIQGVATGRYGAEPLDFLRIIKGGALNRDNPFVSWWYNRSSQLTSITVEAGLPLFGLGEARDYLGHELEDPWAYMKYLADQVIPIAMSSVTQPIMWHEEAPTPMTFLSEVVGLRTFPISQWEKLSDMAGPLIKEMDESEINPDQIETWRAEELTWRDLDLEQKAILRVRYPEIAEQEEVASEARLRWGTPVYKNWWQSVTNAKDWLVQRGAILSEKLIAGDIPIRDFRMFVNEMNQNYGAMYDAIKSNEAWDYIYAEFDRREYQDAEGIDAAYYEYTEKIIGGDFEDEDGFFDFVRYDKALDDFTKKFGSDVYEIVLDIMESNKLGQNPLVVALWRDKKELRDYWDVPYKPIIEMDEDDEAEGNIPAEYLLGWRVYKALETDEQREEFIKEHPDLAKDWRVEYRKENPEADAMLSLWDYGGSLQTKEGYDLLKQRCDELGIKIETVVPDLPPSRLMGDYFDYKKIPFPFSGYEREWFLGEHPKFYEWGRNPETLGWEEIDFEGLPTREEVTLLEEYDALSTEGDARKQWRYNNSEGDAALVRVRELRPIREWWRVEPRLPPYPTR